MSVKSNRPRRWASWFDLSNPGRIVGVYVGVAGAALLLLVVAAIVSAVLPGREVRAPWLNALGYSIGGLFLLFAIFVCVVGVATAIHLPAPQPLRERSLWWAAVTWIARTGWGMALLVISGMVGGFIAWQIGSMSDALSAAGESQSAAATADMQLVDMIYSWIVASLGIFALPLLSLPVWLAVRLDNAGEDGRRIALAETLKRIPSSPRKEAWLTHLSDGMYSGVFAVAGILVIIFLFLTLLFTGLDAAHTSLDTLLKRIGGQ